MRGAFACGLTGMLFAAVMAVGSEPRSNAASPRRQEYRQSADEKFSGFLEIGGESKVQIGGLAVDRTGNVYVTGGFNGALVFSTTPRTVLRSTSDYDVFVAKYTPNRTCLWARVANGADNLPEKRSVSGGLSVSARAWNRTSRAATANLFHGHTARQSSQP